MADVARAAGVSTATVSHFLSGRAELLRRMSPDVQERVGDAVRMLGYVHNKAARHLRLQRTERICVLLPQLGIPYADQIAKDIDAVAQSRGYSTIIVTGHSIDVWRNVINDVEAGLADGLVADADGHTERDLHELFGERSRLSKAHLILHANATPKGFSVVNYDRLTALRHALEHLRSGGRKRLAYIENTSSRPMPRAALVRDYTARPEHGMAPATVIEGASARSDAARVVGRLLAMAERPDCIVVESDFAAVTVIEELQRHGVDVPREIAVIGCGNAEEGYFANPRLTTIGPAAVSLTEPTGHLIDIIESRGAAGNRRFVLPWSLILRESA